MKAIVWFGVITAYVFASQAIAAPAPTPAPTEAAPAAGKPNPAETPTGADSTDSKP